MPSLLPRDFVEGMIKTGVELGEEIGHALILMLMRIRACLSPSAPTAWVLGIALKAQTKVQVGKAVEISALRQERFGGQI